MASLTKRDNTYALLISGVAFMVAAIFVFRFGYNLPYWDEWELIPYLKKLYAHESISFHELMAAHNEHRIFFPRIIMLVMAAYTHWDLKAEMYVSLILMLLSYIVVYSALIKTFNSIKSSDTISLGFVTASLLCSVLYFSVNQSQNLLWGWQIQIFLSVLAIIVSCYLLTRNQTIDTNDFIGSYLFAIIATFSFANGLVSWLVGGAILLIRWKQTTNFFIKSAIWAVSFIACVYIYFVDMPARGAHPPKLLLVGIPYSIKFLLSYLGAPMILETPMDRFAVYSPYPSVPVGLFGLTVAVFFMAILIKKKVLFDRRLLFWHALLCYSFLSACLTTLGRRGEASPMESRYTTISQFFWIWIFVVGLYIACRFYSLNRKVIFASSIFYISLFIYYSHANFLKAQIKYNEMPYYQTILEQNTMLMHDTPGFGLHVHPVPLKTVDKNNTLRQLRLAFYY